mgnify:CR=1 FL=1
MHLEEIAFHVAPGAHAVLLLDQAGWHGSAELVVPDNITLLYLPPYSPDRNPDELVWKHLKSDTVGRTSITCLEDFRNKVKSSMLSLQRDPDKIRSFFHKPSLRYAA